MYKIWREDRPEEIIETRDWDEAQRRATKDDIPWFIECGCKRPIKRFPDTLAEDRRAYQRLLDCFAQAGFRVGSQRSPS